MRGIKNHRPYCYVPFVNSSGMSAGSYDQLVNQVSLKKYDAAVGDVSITAERSQNVDYTLPYMGYSGVIAITASKTKMRTWFFLEPFTWKLWVTTFCFFVFIGIVVWILEHGQNHDFEGPISNQIGTSVWFSFSIMVFAHRERIGSNLTRMVVIVSRFLKLLLTQTYSAALSSHLTIQHFEPKVNHQDGIVGYQQGSFVNEMLLNLGFINNDLVPYKSADDCCNLLSLGSKKGGIDAAFDEMAFKDLILTGKCKKFFVDPNPMSRQRYLTDGFGFVFPRGSPIAPDLSRQVLALIESKRIETLRKKWFGNDKDNTDSTDNSAIIDIDQFWVLFLFTAIVSFIALIIHLYKLVSRKDAKMTGPTVPSVAVVPLPEVSTSSPISEESRSPGDPSSPHHTISYPNEHTPQGDSRIQLINLHQSSSVDIIHENN